MSLSWTFLDETAPDWPIAVDRLYARPELAGQALVPAYFVKTSFVRMGGRLALLRAGDGSLLALGYLFPRSVEAGRRIYTLRLHAPHLTCNSSELLAALEPHLAPAQVVLYRPEAGYTCLPTHYRYGDFDIGAPSLAELPAIRRLRSDIWGLTEDEAYPLDLHGVEFAPATSLAARYRGEVVGFLLGFYRFGLAALEELALPYRSDLLVESQVMGVAPSYRRAGVAAALKREQARQALAQGIDIIHWTADPLQWPNAVLNFSKLRAVSGEFYRDYYPVYNTLNRVTASRLGLVWLPRSAHSAPALAGYVHTECYRLDQFPRCAILNDGPQPRPYPADALFLALEVPIDWTTLQHRDPAAAAAWRSTTDALLEACLGFTPGRYLITDVAAQDGRCYLVARRFDPTLLRPAG